MSQTIDSPLLKGIFSALVTPFDHAGAFTPAPLAGLMRFGREQGLAGFYVGGTTSEAFLLSTEERAEMLRAAADADAGASTLIAHVGALSTAETVRLAYVASDCGYHAVSAIPPFYFNFSAREIVLHFEALLDATPLPLIVYNYGGSGSKIGLEDMADVLVNPRVIGIKHTSLDLYALERTKRRYPHLLMYNGHDEVCLGGLGMGADGAIGTTYNFMGGLFVRLEALFKAGEIDAARELQMTANRIIDLLIDVGVLPATKTILALMGLDCGICRLPFQPVSAANRDRLEALVASFPSLGMALPA